MMTGVGALVARNLLLFLRDRMAVFFSLLSALILVLLYTLFLGELQISNLREAFPTASRTEIAAFIDAWMFAGIVAMTATTTGLGALGVLVDDAARGRSRDLLIAPVPTGAIVLGYLLSAVVVTLAMTFGVLALSLSYLWLADGLTLSISSVLRVAGAVLVISIAFTALAALVTSFVSSPGAYAALSTIVGTVLGFLTGAYIPVGSFPEPVQDTVTVLPFAQAALLLRQEFASAPLHAVTADRPAAESPLRVYFGLDAAIAGHPVAPPVIIAVLIGLAIVCTLLSTIRMRGRLGRRHVEGGKNA
ncbi:ABC transporter permease [Microbacterium sp. Mu-43]|uniref:ABC transporter permease n=2 Tax=Microbacterium istanbulense TaxID=3122049 RepID=A0ABU8LJ09_9MICO